MRLIRCWLRRRRARWCAQGLAPGRALEIGCGEGWLLEALHRAGWDVVGTERSPQSAAHARHLGLDIRVGDLKDVGLPERSFDLVILWHVLEHLQDPLGTLVDVHRMLRPPGRLIIAVPNAGSWQASVAGPKWLHLDVPRHQYHFDPQTLGWMLQRAGFRTQTWYFSGLTYEWAGWYDLLTAHAESRIASGALAAMAGLLTMALWIPAAHYRRGAAMIIWASPFSR